jgi:hypothetical protein
VRRSIDTFIAIMPVKYGDVVFHVSGSKSILKQKEWFELDATDVGHCN